MYPRYIVCDHFSSFVVGNISSLQKPIDENKSHKLLFGILAGFALARLFHTLCEVI